MVLDNVLNALGFWFKKPEPICGPEGCPNCWGRQEWENEKKEARFDLSKDSSSIAHSRDGFIRRFAKRYIRGRRKKITV